MKRRLTPFFVILLFPLLAWGEGPVSEDTQACIDCHLSSHPGIVRAWEESRMSRVTPSEAKARPELERRVSFDSLPDPLSRVVVGCAECHSLDPEKHADSFDHNGYAIHIVVTPGDCTSCHPLEAEQFAMNLMSHAYGNLMDNPVYRSLVDAVNGIQDYRGAAGTTLRPPDPETHADACLYCHGTRIEIGGEVVRETDLGEMTFPVLKGWPNQGVGRINPDGTKGSCAACHTRHRFSIEMARKPHTCSECHKGPDVPAYPVYEVSKHGNTYSALGGAWSYDPVPWVVGRDFTAPTCAACHVSLLTDGEGGVLARRTHQMNDRLSWRIFGLIYAHPHPESPDTTIIRNGAGLPLPTELTGEPVSNGLISEDIQKERRERMQGVCLSCHARSWVDGQFARFEHTLGTTNEMTLTATRVMLSAWEKGAASGLNRKDSLFNEALEKMWVEQWLFYANSTRFASAMAGADYGVFANGRWNLAKNIQDMIDRLKILSEDED